MSYPRPPYEMAPDVETLYERVAPQFHRTGHLRDAEAADEVAALCFSIATLHRVQAKFDDAEPGDRARLGTLIEKMREGSIGVAVGMGLADSVDEAEAALAQLFGAEWRARPRG